MRKSNQVWLKAAATEKSGLTRSIIMKKVVILLFVISISVNLFAQKRPGIDSMNKFELNLYKERATELRNYGIGMVLSGATLIAVGGCLSIAWFKSLPENEENFGIPIFPFLIGLAIGLPVSLAGIPVWAIGDARKSKAEIALKSFQGIPGKPLQQGLAIRFRF